MKAELGPRGSQVSEREGHCAKSDRLMLCAIQWLLGI